MADIYLPPNSICNSISHNVAYNANYDIVWSFDYALSGNSTSQGSFTTFLFNGDTILSGGGPGQGGGYYSAGNYISGGNTISTISVVSAILGINFDTTGLFALSSDLFGGILSATPNRLSIRYGQTNFNLITSVPLSSIYTNFPFLLSSIEFNRLRFRLTDVGQTLKIDYKTLNGFTEIFKIPIKLHLNNNTTYKIGLSYTSPVSGSDSSPATLAIKNFHVEGKTEAPTTNIIPLENNSLAVYPVCALPDIPAPTDSITVRSLAKITDIACPVDPPISQELNVCLATFVPISASRDYVVSAPPALQGSYTYVNLASAEITNLSEEESDTFIESDTSGLSSLNYISCGEEVEETINFNFKTRGDIPYPIRYIADITPTTKQGLVTISYAFSGAPIKVIFRTEMESGSLTTDTLSFFTVGDYDAFAIDSERVLRGNPLSSVGRESYRTQREGALYFNKAQTSLADSSLTADVFAPFSGSTYKFTIGCVNYSTQNYGVQALTGVAVSGINFISPLSGELNYYPYPFDHYSWVQSRTVSFSYSAYDLPKRFQVVDYNTERIWVDTGWVGLSADYTYNLLFNYLERVGEPVPDTIGPSLSTHRFVPTFSPSPGDLLVKVYSPFWGSRWHFNLSAHQ